MTCLLDKSMVKVRVARVFFDMETYVPDSAGGEYLIGAAMDVSSPDFKRTLQSFPLGPRRREIAPSIEELTKADFEVWRFVVDNIFSLSESHDYVFFIGYNHTEYDLPLLYRRVGTDYIFRFHGNIIHIDLHDVVLALHGFRPSGTSLRSVVKKLGIVDETRYDVDVQSAVGEGRLDLVYSHLLEDISLTKKLFDYVRRKVGECL